MDTESLEAFYANKNTTFFDWQTKALFRVARYVIGLLSYFSSFIDIQTPFYNALQDINHPMVSACANLSTCGPFQIFWENFVVNYNDPTILPPLASFVTTKTVIVVIDFVFLFLLFSIPILVNLFAYLNKFYGVLDQSKQEFAMQQLVNSQ